MKYLLRCIIFSVVSLAASAQQSSLPDTMPQWQLPTEDGQFISSDNFSGKPLVLHFWATWCPYCKRLQPGLDRLAQTYAKDGLQVLAVSLSEKPDAQPQAVLKARGLKLKTVVEGDELGLKHFAIAGTPTTVFIAPNGNVLGATMQSDPDDPQWKAVAEYLIKLPRN